MIKPYYETELGKLYHGDCLEIMPDLEPVDLVLTDPPYEESAHTCQRRTRAVIEGKKINDKIPFKKIDEQTRCWLSTIKCNWILIFCQAEAVGIYSKLFRKAYRRPMVWIKPDSAPQFTGDRPAMGYESIICAWQQKNGKSYWNSGGKRGVYTHNCTSGRKTTHPTEKPIGLFIELIQDFGLNGIVADPFFGSGTTGAACERLKCKWIGIEISEEYCEIAAKRIEQERSQLKLW